MNQFTAFLAVCGVVAALAFAFRSCNEAAAACAQAGKCWRGRDGSCVTCDKIQPP